MNRDYYFSALLGLACLTAPAVAAAQPLTFQQPGGVQYELDIAAGGTLLQRKLD